MIELKEEIDKATIIVGNFNTPCSIDRTRQKSNTDREELNNAINQDGLTDTSLHLQNTSLHKARVQILSECSQDMYQGRPCPRP